MTSICLQPSICSLNFSNMISICSLNYHFKGHLRSIVSSCKSSSSQSLPVHFTRTTMEMKLDVVCREVIKPSSPSPHDHLQLSILDLTSPEFYASTIFFYKTEELVTESPEIVSGKLKNSLSETLTRFYPLAGRIEGFSISCNDEGAMFTEARTDLLLPEFLRKLNPYSLEPLLPTMAPGESPMVWPLLSVKVTFFGSGSGVAVVASVSHKICDAPSLLAVVTDWAVTTATGKSKVSTIQFAETTICPPPHISFQSESAGLLLCIPGKCVKNRFVFESSKLAELKRKAASKSVPLPTRVEAITSLIWKCARNASRSNSVTPKSSVMTQAVDLRLRIPSTVLSPNAIGNLQTALLLKKGAGSEVEIPETVAAFRKAKEELNQMIKENVQGNTLGQSLLNKMETFMSEPKIDIDIYAMSSWCRKPFYEVDFGWGSPVWLGSAIHAIYENFAYVVLTDSKDGEGVEALINLPEQDMSVFVRDQELLAYAVLNPPVLI